MEKLNILGTGHAMTLDCYNTCFTLENNEGEEYNLLIDDLTIREITLCIYSLAHKIQYNDGNGNKGNLEFFIDGSNEEIILGLKEESRKKPYIVIAKYKGYKYIKGYCSELVLAGSICTKRVNNKLQLFVGYDIIIECIS